MSEQINHPNHYGGDTIYEAIKVIEAWGFDKDFCLGNTVKYISRAGKKDSGKLIEDLKKAKWYLDRKISQLENNPCFADKGFEVVVQYIPSINDRWWYKNFMAQTFQVTECTEEEFKTASYMYDSEDRKANEFYKVVKSNRSDSSLNGQLILKTHCIQK